MEKPVNKLCLPQVPGFTRDYFKGFMQILLKGWRMNVCCILGCVGYPAV